MRRSFNTRFVLLVCFVSFFLFTVLAPNGGHPSEADAEMEWYLPQLQK